MPTIKNPTPEQKAIIAESEAALNTGKPLTGEAARRWREKTAEPLGLQPDGSIKADET